jgi:6-phosphogluconolactonase (cycloisomerase 2 family)
MNTSRTSALCAALLPIFIAGLLSFPAILSAQTPPVYAVVPTEAERVQLYQVNGQHLLLLTEANTGRSACGAVWHTSGVYFYVATCIKPSTVSVYRRDPHTNAVHLLQTEPAGLLVGHLVVSNDGHHLYAAKAAGSVDPRLGYVSGIIHWRILGDGTLEFSEVTPSGGTEVRGLAIAYDDSFLAAANYASATAAFFSLTTPDRIPKLLGTLPTAPGPIALGITGEYLLVLARHNFTVSSYRLPDLAWVATTQTDAGPRALAFSGDGQRVFLLCDVGVRQGRDYIGTIQAFQMHNGALTFQARVSTGSSNSRALAVSDDDNAPVLLVANDYGPHIDDNTVQRFGITAGDLIRLDPAMLVNGPTDVVLTNRFHSLAVNDMAQQAANDARFGAPYYAAFGKGFKDAAFSITQMPFDFGGGTTLMVHALSNEDSNLRFTMYYDTAAKQWTEWTRVE